MKMLNRWPHLMDRYGSNDLLVPVEVTPVVGSVHEQVLPGMRRVLDYVQTGAGSAPSLVEAAGVDFPIRPPWTRSFVEFTLPDGPRPRVGLRVRHIDPDGVQKDLANHPRLSRDADLAAKVHDGAIVHAWQSIARQRPQQVGGFEWFFDKEGVPVHFGYKAPGVDALDEAGRSYQTIVYALLLAGVLAFLNCNNVSVADEAPVPPKVAKKRAKRGYRGVVYRRVLVDGRPITASAGESSEEAEIRHHICRGHFADHREHGLFGKESLKGIYWVPMHARGSRSVGEVVKDYEVRVLP